MKIIFPNTKEAALFLMRRAGYGFEKINREKGEEAFSRRLGSGEYPKFHVYAHKESGSLIVNLHLDQKKPVYAGVTAHSGEYDGEIIEAEAERIKILINKAEAETVELKNKFADKPQEPFFKKITKIFSRNK